MGHLATAIRLMFGLPDELVVVIPDKPRFCSLYSDGVLERKVYIKESGETLLAYSPGALLFLYYNYPTHRAASCIRNVPGNSAFPSLSKKVSLLFSVHASKVDKLKKAIGFLNKNAGGAYHFDDDFYLRLLFVLEQRGKLNYPALRSMVERESLKGA